MNFDKKELYTAKRSSGVNVDPDIALQWNVVRSDSENDNFILLTYSGNDIVLCAHGDGGLQGLLSHLNDDHIFFGGLRAEVDGLIKFFSFSFIGSAVNGMKKGKASLHKTAVFNTLEGCHGEISCPGGIEDATKESIILRIMRCTGVTNRDAIVF